MKKWIPFFLMAFCAGMVIGGFLAKYIQERGMRTDRESDRADSRKQSYFSGFAAHADIPLNRLYLRIIRGEDGPKLLTSFRLSPSGKTLFFSELQHFFPEGLRLERRDFSRLLSLYEFQPGGVFRTLRPEEWCRNSLFELGYSRLGERIYILEPISEPVSGLREPTSFPDSSCSGTAVPEEIPWIPVSILLVCIVLGFLLLLIQKRREE